MRVLFASTGGAGHFNPLVSLVEACRRQGHAVPVAGPPAQADAVRSSGYPYWRFEAPPPDELDAVWSRVPSVSPDEQNVIVIRDIFARLNSAASLPSLRQACETWRPDVVIRDPNEYGSAVAAELHGTPAARVGIGLVAMEELGLRIAAGAVDALRRSVALAADPDATTLRSSPYLTMFPASFEDDAEPAQPIMWRYRDPTWDRRPRSYRRGGPTARPHSST